MFRSASVKIAHSSTIPVPVLIDEALRPLQDLIAAEKVVLTSLQKLSSDFAKAADAMKTWALSEGDDISDVLNSSRTLLAHFSGALNHYSSIQGVVRDNMKAIRTREEFLADLRRHRRRTAASMEATRKKVSRMNQESKAFGAQMYALNLAGENVRDLDTKIAREESTIGAFKRKCTRNWLTLKFGGLAECCEKGMIVAGIGKRMVLELSESPQNPYVGGKRTTSLLSEAQHRIVQVVFSGAPSGNDTSEASRPPLPRRRPSNRFKDLPEIRIEPISNMSSVGYGTPISSQSSTNPVPLPEHVLSGIGPSTPCTAECDYYAEPSPSICEPPLALLPDRGTTGSAGDKSYSSFMRSRIAIGFRLDSIEEGDECSPSPSISNDVGEVRACLNQSPDMVLHQV